MQKVLLVYSEANADDAHRMRVHLAPFVESRGLEIWDHREIPPGGDVHLAAGEAVTRADVAIVLVTADFLAAPLGQPLPFDRLLRRAEDGGLTLIAVIADYCDWQEVRWLHGVRVLPQDGVPVAAQLPRSKAWTQVSREIGVELRGPARSPVPRASAAPGSTPIPVFVGSNLDSWAGGDPRFFGRRNELATLSEWFADPTCRGAAVVAFGGVGKSALVREWVSKRARGHRAHRVVGYSFSSQGTQREANSEQFLTRALQALGDPDPSRGTPTARGERLGGLLCETPTVLVLDGLEPLQFGASAPARCGELRDQGVRALLGRMLERASDSVFFVTSRLELRGDLFRPKAYREMRLDVLPLATVRQIFRSRGVKGSDHDLDDAAEYLGRHALAVALAAEYVYTFQRGEIRAVREIPLVSDDVREGRHAKSVMEAYVVALRRDGNEIDLEFLKLFGLFDRPIRWEWVNAVCARPAISGLTDRLSTCTDEERWESFSRLRQWNLLSADGLGPDAAIDSHPLVREYFGTRLEHESPTAWAAAHLRLLHFFADTAETLPSTLDDMEPLLLGAAHGCKAGRYKETLKSIFLKRIMRGDQGFAAIDLQARESVLSVLSNFFEHRRWSAPIAPRPAPGQALSRGEKLVVLLQSAQTLAASRGYAAPESELCYTRAQDLCSPRSGDAFTVLHGLWHCSLARGALAQSGGVASRLKRLASTLRNPMLAAVSSRVLATQYFYIGEFDQSLESAQEVTPPLTPDDLAARRFLVDPYAICMAYEALSHWHLGDPDAAALTVTSAVAQARATAHPLTCAVVMYLTSLVHVNARDARRTADLAGAAVELCEEEGFALWRSTSRIVLGWAIAQEPDRLEEGLERMQQAFASWTTSGSNMYWAFWASLFADCLIRADRYQEALDWVERGLKTCDDEARWCESELHRLKGILLTHVGEQWDEAEVCCRQALHIAQRRRSVIYELRAARDLCRIVERSGKTERPPYELIESACSQMLSGRGSKDVREARAMLPAG